MRKVSCHGCRALEPNGPFSWRCQLLKTIRLDGAYSTPVPAEKCPKPRTISAFHLEYGRRNS